MAKSEFIKGKSDAECRGLAVQYYNRALRAEGELNKEKQRNKVLEDRIERLRQLASRIVEV